MATDSRTATSGALPDMSDIGNQVTSHLASADSVAAQRVQTLMWVHQARAAQLARTAASLKGQYGASDPGVKSAEAAVAAAKANAARVAVVHRQVTTPEPRVAPKGWTLHGRVFDAQLAPVSGYTVFFVDSAKAFQQAYGFAYTDDTGYFLLSYEGSEEASGERPARAVQATELFVEVADRRARPVYLGAATPFQPVRGSATYQNHVLPAGEQPIGDPPPQIRRVALPKRKRQP